MARDRLIPAWLCAVNARGVPARVTVFTAVVAAVMAGLVPLKRLAEVANAGTLAAFIATALAMMLLRRARPELARPFRTPLWWAVGPLAVAGCLYLFSSLATFTQLFFVGANAIGLVVYLLYGRTRSALAAA
jgi:APA family basic amino acid/polyamine antiporter